MQLLISKVPSSIQKLIDELEADPIYIDGHTKRLLRNKPYILYQDFTGYSFLNLSVGAIDKSEAPSRTRSRYQMGPISEGKIAWIESDSSLEDLALKYLHYPNNIKTFIVTVIIKAVQSESDIDVFRGFLVKLLTEIKAVRHDKDFFPFKGELRKL